MTRTFNSNTPVQEQSYGEVEQFSLTRSRVDSRLRVARTLADLEGKEAVGAEHIEEAINYRSFDRSK